MLLSLSVFVKICGITSEEDALLAVALGADAVGFVFAPSPRQIAVGRARDIARRLPLDVLTVGVFRNDLPERILKIMSQTSLRAVQLHGNESAEETAWIAQRVPTTIKAFPAGHTGLHSFKDYHADILLVDSHAPGSGNMFDWSLAEDAPLVGTRLLLAGGLDPENVERAIERVRPWGVDVSTGVESSPGHKDPSKMRLFIQNAKSAQTSEKNPEAQSSDSKPSALYNWESDGYIRGLDI